MRASKSLFIKGAVIAFLAGTVVTAAHAQPDTATVQTESKTYVVCNQYDECWRVHEHLNTYPGDVHITWHDDAWYQAHQHDSHWRWLADPSDDHGWYDREGNWHAFSDGPH
jgi:hypothetical protein